MPELSRRQLMGGAALTAGATVLRPSAATATGSGPPVDADVVIVGAGLAGLLPPGALTQDREAIWAPVGRLHWAGTETATFWHGNMDGAISSGRRAAAEASAPEQWSG